MKKSSKHYQNNLKIIELVGNLFSFALLFAFYFLYSKAFLEISANFREISYFLKQNKLEAQKVKKSGKIVYRYSADFANFDTWFYFIEEEEKKFGEYTENALFSVDDPKKLGVVDFPIEAMYREKVEFYHLKNAFVNPYYDIILSNGDYLYMLRNFLWGPDDQDQSVLETSRCYEHVIFIPFYFQNFFGHVINDGIGGLLSMPRWVWMLHPVIVTSADKELVYLFMKFADIPIVPVKGDWVFGANVYICKAAEPWHGFGIHYFQDIKRKIQEYYQLDKITPTLYRFLNKEYGTRHFLNMDEMVATARNITNIDWQYMHNKYLDRLLHARTLASIKILVVPGGSIIFNTVYMKDYSGTVILMASFIDMPNFATNFYNKIWTIAVHHSNMNHYEGPGYGDIPRIMDAIQKMIYTVDNQKFPPNHNLFKPINKTFHKGVYMKNGDTWISWPFSIKASIEGNYSSVGNSEKELKAIA